MQFPYYWTNLNHIYIIHIYIYIIIHNIYIYTYISPRNVPITWLESTSPMSLLVRQPHICCQSFPCWDERLPVTQFFCAELLLAQRTRHEFFHSCLLGTSAQRKPAGPWQEYQTSGKKPMVSWCFLSILAGLRQNLPKAGEFVSYPNQFQVYPGVLPWAGTIHQAIKKK